jgi:hypothetical protein
MDDDARDHRPLAALARNSSPLASQKDSPSSIQGGSPMPYSARPNLCEGRTAMSVPGRDLYWLPSRTQECEAEGEGPLDNQRDTFSRARHPARLKPAYPSRADAGLIICRGREGAGERIRRGFRTPATLCAACVPTAAPEWGCCQIPTTKSSGKMAPSSWTPLVSLEPVNVRERRRACAARGEIRSRQLLAPGPQVGPPPRPPH